MHKDWCGKPCCDCQSPCSLDEEIPCSPDCECLGEGGETTCEACKKCDAISKEFQIHVYYDGVIIVKASSEEDARSRAIELTCEDLYKISNGTWEIGEIENI